MLSDLDEKLDPRIERTRTSILEAFSDMLAEQNFEAISVKDVTGRAQINRATFYAHFQDKYALLDHAIQSMFVAEIEKRTLNVCSYTPENLRNLIGAVCEFLGNLHSSCTQPHQQFESLVEGTIKKQIFDLLSHWLRQSAGSTEIPVTVATWAIYGLASHYSHARPRPALDKFVAEAFPYVAASLAQFP